MHAPKQILDLEKKFTRTDLPELRAGDRVKVHSRISEGSKERIQVVEGLVIRLNGNGVTRTVTVRKLGAGGIGVELIYPLCSPKVAKIEVVHQGKVRQARLYYMRKLAGKAARLKKRGDSK